MTHTKTEDQVHAANLQQEATNGDLNYIDRLESEIAEANIRNSELLEALKDATQSLVRGSLAEKRALEAIKKAEG